MAWWDPGVGEGYGPKTLESRNKLQTPSPGGFVLSEIMQAKPATAALLAVILGCRGDSLILLICRTPHPWRVH